MDAVSLLEINETCAEQLKRDTVLVVRPTYLALSERTVVRQRVTEQRALLRVDLNIDEDTVEKHSQEDGRRLVDDRTVQPIDPTQKHSQEDGRRLADDRTVQPI